MTVSLAPIANALQGVTGVVFGGYLNGLTANVQSQINNITTGGAFVNKGADTMTGNLGLNYANATPDRAAYLDSNRVLRTSANVDSSELEFLDGVTSNIGAKINKFTVTEAGYLSGLTTGLAANLNGLTANVQTQLNTKLSATDVSGKLDKGADTMTGNLGLNYANATPDRAAYLDSNRVLRTSANVDSSELEYLDGVTSNIGAKINKFTATEAGYLTGLTTGLAANINGLTANVQTQLNTKLSATDVSGKLDKGADTMTGDLGLAGSAVPTTNRVLYLDATRKIATAANVDATELDYLDGVTSTVSKINSFTATEATYLSGLTTNLGTKLNPVTTAEIGYLVGNTASIGSKLNGVTVNLTPIANALQSVTGTALGGYLNGLTANVQSQINNISSGGAFVAKVGDTMTGPLGVSGGVNITNAAGVLSIGGNVMVSVGTGYGAGNQFYGQDPTGWLTTGKYNTVVGNTAGQHITTGQRNTILGYSAGGTLQLGSYNTFLGNVAGMNVLSGQNNTFLGSSAGATVTSQSNNTFVGYGADDTGGAAKQAVALGYNAIVTAGSAVQLGTGTNSTANSLQFNGYNFLNDSGAATFASVNGVTTNGLAANLNGLTANVQAQINNITTGGAFVNKGADTMTGDLGLAGAAVPTTNRVLYLDAARKIATASNVDSTELNYIDGLTTGLAANLNGLTANVQTQLNSKLVAGDIAGKLDKGADTMTGNLGLAGAAIAATNKALILNASRQVATSTTSDTELGYLSGVTSSVSKINSFTATEATYLSGLTTGLAANLNGLTANVQSQINNITTGGAFVNKGADTMTGNLGLNYANATPDRAAYLDSNRVLRTSANVDSTELDYLDGLTSALASRLNGVTLNLAPMATALQGVTGSMLGSQLIGLTANVQSQLNGITTTLAPIATALQGVTGSMLGSQLIGLTANVQNQLNAGVSGKLSKAADTMTGDLGLAGAAVSPSRALFVDAARKISTGNTTDTELGYLNGVTSTVSKINSFTATEATYLSGLTSNLGAKLNPVTTAEIGYLSGLTTGLAANLNGLTANVQTQINAIPSATTRVAKTGDSMSGALHVGAAVDATAFDTNVGSGAYKIGGQTVLSIGTGVGAGNTMGGATAGISITSGTNNTSFGFTAGGSNATGNANSFFGSGAGLLTTAGGNTGVGFAAGYMNTSGTYNTYLGMQAGYNSSTGMQNTMLGSFAGYSVTSGSQLTLLGVSANVGSTVNNAVAIGYNAAVTANSSVQLGTGTNSTANSLQFNGYNFLDGAGAATFASVNGVTTNGLAANLNGLTANVQTQLNNITAGSTFVNKGADTMTGNLGLAGSAVPTTNRVLYLDAARKIATAANVDSTELDYLDGVTSTVSKINSFTATEATYLSGLTTNLGAKLNPATTAEIGYLVGNTANIGSKLNGVTVNLTPIANALQSVTGTALGGYLNGLTANVQSQFAAQVTKAGDTMTGNLGLAGAAVPNASRALYLNASRQIATATTTDTELNYLSGLTTGLAANLNGLTANVQTQFAAQVTKAGDTMTGNLGLAGAAVTPSRALFVDAARKVSTGNTTDTELGYLNGVTSTVSKINSFTATEATYLTGLTSALASRLNGVTVSLAPIGNALQGITGTAMGGYLNGVTSSFIPIMNALQGVTGLVLDTYLMGLTANVQTQINSLAPMSTTIITGNTQAAVSNIYVTNSASLVGVTLPSTCAVGDRIKVVGLGTGGWKIIQNASQTIDYAGAGDSTDTGSITTSGTGGYLQSINDKAAVEVMCRVANTSWIVTASDGQYGGNYVAGVSTFTTTGVTAGVTTVTIPANVYKITVKAWGGGGGGGGSHNGNVSAVGGAGGGGAFATGSFSVRPGDVLNITVGSGGPGGTGGGTGSGGGGGGYSVVTNGAQMLVLAGGGGGGGSSAAVSTTGGAGGAGGLYSGLDGGIGTGGGTTDAGGGAKGAAGGYPGSTGLSSSYEGNRGSPFQGGTAAINNIMNLPAPGGFPGGGGGGQTAATGGGGGGGGWGGGGAGAGWNNNSKGGGGGGGGSSVSQSGGASGSGTTAGGSGDPNYGSSAGQGGAGGSSNGAGTTGNPGRVVIIW